MGYLKEQEADDKRKSQMSENQYRCTTCGHTIYIFPGKEKGFCDFCKRYIFRNEKYNIKHLTVIEHLKRRYEHCKRKNKKLGD